MGNAVPRPSETPEYSVCIPYSNYLSHAALRAPAGGLLGAFLGGDGCPADLAKLCQNVTIQTAHWAYGINQRGWGADALWLFFE